MRWYRSPPGGFVVLGVGLALGDLVIDGHVRVGPVVAGAIAGTYGLAWRRDRQMKRRERLGLKP